MFEEQKSPYKKERYFTNRESQISAFKTSISQIFENKYSVINFYGIGGIGKSRLKHEFIKILEDESILFCKINFNDVLNREVENALFTMYTQLKAEVRFPAFEIAYSILWQKLNPNISLKEDNLPFIQPGSFIGELISVTTEFSFVSIFPKILSGTYKLSQSLIKWWTKFGEPHLKTLHSLEIEELKNTLPFFFSLDLKNHYQIEEIKMVFLLDTYEALWSDQSERKNERFEERDKWVNTLIGNLPHTLWAIFGREPLIIKSGVHNQEQGFIKYYPLTEVSEEYANTYLVNCNVVDGLIREQMLKSAKGLPFYLELHVETYETILESGNLPNALDFNITYSEILTRFCKYLSPSEIETLKILSLARSWDRNTFSAVIEKYHTGYPITAFHEITRFSFVNYSASSGQYHIHDIMAKHLQNQFSNNDRAQIISFYSDYFDRQISIASPTTQTLTTRLTTELAGILREAIYYQQLNSTDVTFAEWLYATSKRFFGTDHSQLFQTHLLDCLEKIDPKYLLLKIDMVRALYNRYRWDGELIKCREILDKGLELYHNTDHKLIEKWQIASLPLALFELYDLKGSLAQTFGQYKDALEYGYRALNLVSRYNLSRKITWIHKVYIQLGMICEAQNIILDALSEAQKTGVKIEQGFELSKLVFFLTSQNCPLQALYLSKHCDQIFMEVADREHPLNTFNTHQIQALLSLNRLSEAQVHLNRYESSLYDVFGEDKIHPDLPFMNLCYGIFYTKKNRIGEALSYFQRCLECASFFPRDHEVFIYATLNIVNIYLDIENDFIVVNDEIHHRALTLHQKVHSIFLEWEGLYYHFYDEWMDKIGRDKYSISFYFQFMEKYYRYKKMDNRLSVTLRRKAQLEQLISLQVYIRAASLNAPVEIHGTEKKLILQRLKNLRELVFAPQIQLFRQTLPFFATTKLFFLKFAGMEMFYFLISEDKAQYINWKTRTIFENFGTDFQLSKETVFDYICFVGDCERDIKGRNFFLLQFSDIPFAKDVAINEVEVGKIRSVFHTPKIIRSLENRMIIKICALKGNTLSSVNLVVNKNATVQIISERILIEKIPASVDTFIYVNESGKIKN